MDGLWRGIGKYQGALETVISSLLVTQLMKGVHLSG
jgi:hypothetical protein